MITMVDGAKALEVAVIGREGLVGVPLALGLPTSPCRVIVQGSGAALRVPAARFTKELRRNPALERVVHRYSAQLMAQISQNAACNRFHTVEERLARWLLITSDRLGSMRFLLTHRFLSHMLGVRREGVTIASAALKRRQLIDHSRGEITILDRAGLEAVSCSCYAVFRKLVQT
jgi:CRP-like cAMP-binding protein